MRKILLKVSTEAFELSAKDVSYYNNLTKTFQQSLQKNILRCWEMQWDVARFQTQIIRESLYCGTSPISMELQLQLVTVQYYLVTNFLLKPQKSHCLTEWEQNHGFPKYSYCWYVIWQEQELNEISVDVKSCGLWIHKKYPHLGASPNRLVWENNNLVVIEMKFLKILKRHKIQEFIGTFENGKMSDQVKRQ